MANFLVYPVEPVIQLSRNNLDTSNTSRFDFAGIFVGY